jgi:hypothetical protein
MQAPRWTSHSRHELSLEPVARYSEFGWNLTHWFAVSTRTASKPKPKPKSKSKSKTRMTGSME